MGVVQAWACPRSSFLVRVSGRGMWSWYAAVLCRRCWLTVDRCDRDGFGGDTEGASALSEAGDYRTVNRSVFGVNERVAWCRRGLRFLTASCMAVFALAAMRAQTPPAAGPTFEVATVKPGAPDSNDSNVGFNVGRFTTKNATLKFIIQIAYNLNSGSEEQIVGGPSWVRSAPFDIYAKEDDALAAKIEKMPAEEHAETLRVMIQRLLADRFGLTVHFETRELPVNALVVAKGGSKLKPSVAAATSEGSGSGSAPRWGGLHNDGHGEVEGRSATLDMLANVLAAQPELGGRTVVNKTGMSGSYDFTLRWTPDIGTGAPSGKEGADAAGPSLFTALQEQLGLKIESRKEPLQVLVIDHVGKPSEN